MDIRKLQRAIVDGLEDVKASDVQVFNTEHLSPLFERVVIASGNSNRQTKALASSVRESVKAAGGYIVSVEGEDNGEWIIVDCGAAVAHIMQPAIRQYYHLEEIWGGKPVRMKLAGVQQGLPKASTVADAEAVPARHGRTPAAAADRPARTTSARGSSASEALAEAKAKAPKARPARQAPARPATTPQSARKTPTAPVAARKGVARKAPARKAAVKTSGGSVAASSRKPRSA